MKVRYILNENEKKKKKGTISIDMYLTMCSEKKREQIDMQKRKEIYVYKDIEF